jgi:hypothetical protein
LKGLRSKSHSRAKKAVLAVTIHHTEWRGAVIELHQIRQRSALAP